MLIEQSLERKILDAIAAIIPASAPGHRIVGIWQQGAAGGYKGLERPADGVARIEVATGLGVQPTFSAPTVTFEVSITLEVRLELDPQGVALPAFAEPISALFREWMSATYQQRFDALDVPGLSIDGVGVAGSVPSVDRDEQTATVAWSLSLSGTYQNFDNPTN